MKNKVINILNQIRPEFDFSEPIENFTEAGMLDSFDVVTLVTSLDEEFEISIDGEDILPENFSSLSRIMILLNKYNIK
jgi:acyl carrier protein